MKKLITLYIAFLLVVSINAQPVTFCEDFESLTVGDPIAETSSHWNSWDELMNGSVAPFIDDAAVSVNQAFSGTNSLYFLNRDEIPNIYKICKLLFYPSIYEGFGRPLLEAMKCGLPVVCSDNSAIPEVVGNSALMSNCENVDDFTNNILTT